MMTLHEVDRGRVGRDMPAPAAGDRVESITTVPAPKLEHETAEYIAAAVTREAAALRARLVVLRAERRPGMLMFALVRSVEAQARISAPLPHPGPAAYVYGPGMARVRVERPTGGAA